MLGHAEELLEGGAPAQFDLPPTGQRLATAVRDDVPGD